MLTGASSGIGQAAALEFARRRARVVVAARRSEALERVAEACQRFGSPALAVPTDVTDAAAVEALGRRTVERFGRVDVWVNNAGVYAAGRFEEFPAEAFRRVIETNLLGCATGSRVAVRQFRRQGAGVLINTGSVASRIPMAYFSAYTAAKFGVLGLTLTLRQELRGTGIEACVIVPSSTDTPIFQHAANYTGRLLKAMSPVSAPEQVARAIVGLAERPRRMVIVGRGARMLTWLESLAPPLADRFIARLIESGHWQPTPAQSTSGNLFSPIAEWTDASGGWRTGRWPLARRAPDPVAARR